MLARLLYPRLRGLFLKDARRSWNEDVAASSARLEASLTDLRAEIATLRRGYRDLLVAELDRRDAPDIEAVRSRLDRHAIGSHVAQAVADAEVRTHPMPHLVIENLLPADVYALLLRAMPPVEVFQDRDPVKQDFEMGALDTAPALSRLVWRFFDDDLVGGVLASALLQRLAPAVAAHYAETGGPEFGERAAAIPHRSFAGRIQLRRPGYSLQPHLDPKRVVITGLVYFAQARRRSVVRHAALHGRSRVRVGRNQDLFSRTARALVHGGVHSAVHAEHHAGVRQLGGGARRHAAA